METDLLYTNESLGRKYYRLATFYNPEGNDSVKKVKRAIEEAEEDIHPHFLKNGTLEGLKIPGVGKQSMKILKGILNLGVEEVIQGLVGQRDEAIRTWQMQDLSSRTEGPSILTILEQEIRESEYPMMIGGVEWDDAVRAYEGGSK